MNPSHSLIAIVERHVQVTLLAVAVLLGAGCASLKSPAPQPVSAALEPIPAGPLADISRDVQRRFGPGKSGFVLLEENRAAIDWRLALIDHAERSIDLQYYLWAKDDTGYLIFDRLLDAASRGVRVRLLVDDFLFSGNDHRVAALSHDPNFEIKVFNPGYVRGVGSMIEFLFKFGELNRRMHNKVFVVDNRIAIVGGRNIGDHYGGLSKDHNFVDLEVLAAGEVIDDISRGFDVFWNSDAAYPGRELSASASREDVPAILEDLQTQLGERTKTAATAGFPIERRDWSERFRAVGSQWHVGTADFLYDEPNVDPNEERERFLDAAPTLAADVDPQEVIAVTPYLIPGNDFFKTVERYTSKGARVAIIVPSMEANNHKIVHAHYRKYRRRILERGAELYEFRADALPAVRAFADTAPVRSETVGLHLKGFVGDRNACFIGSLNIDPRSIEINTEGGLWIESPGLAREVASHFEFLMEPENAWRITLEEESGRQTLRWESRGQVLKSQPAPGFGARLSDFFYGLLPIRSQL